MSDTLKVDALRITTDEVRKRLQAGEDFVFVDTRNPQAWAQSDVKVQRAIRVPLDDLDQHISEIPKDKSIVSYCT
jgi:rhodanese-related sulfurtransferase